jgi:hypothetical protein
MNAQWPKPLTFTFTGVDDFEAMYQAEAVLVDRGFSVGRNQRGDPRGILYGDYDIQKWRNLNSKERAALHGQITGPMRSGPVTVTIFAVAPEEAREAIIAAKPAP